MKRQFVMTIEVDEKNIFEKYPNYRFNWDSPEDFIRYLAESKEERYYYDLAGQKQSMWKLFGYRTTVKKI
jgi:hypothetical protein